MTALTGGTLFSGIGAPELAMPQVDWRWCAETDPFASAVLAARFPHSRNLGDVTTVDWDAVEPVDLVVFGSPCQSFSVAGKRAGLDDPRGNLALVGLRAVERVRPRWVVWENVPGVLSSDEGRDFGTFLGCLGQCGYGFAYRVLDAQYFGVPQRRRRVFVVGCLGDWHRAAAVLFEQSCLQWNPAPRREAWEGVAGSLEACANGGGARFGTDFMCDGGLTVAGCLQERDYKGSDSDTKPGHLVVTHSLRAEGFDASEDGTGRGTPIIPAQCNGNNVGFDLPSLRAGNQHVTGGGPAIAFHENQRAEITFNDTAGSLKVGGGKPGQGYPAIAFAGMAQAGQGWAPPSCPTSEDLALPLDATRAQAIAFDARQSDVIRYGDGTGPLDTVGSLIGVVAPSFIHPRQIRNSQSSNQVGIKPDAEISDALTSEGPGAVASSMSVRRLTPVECERLQGFPDGFTAIPYRGKPAADGNRYRALGNAMCVDVVRWLGERVALVERAR